MWHEAIETYDTYFTTTMAYGMRLPRAHGHRYGGRSYDSTLYTDTRHPRMESGNKRSANATYFSVEIDSPPLTLLE